jgi:hypothetical protein
VVKPYRFSSRGVQFQIFAQSPALGLEAEPVRLRARPGTIKAGPRDATIHVIDARRKLPYKRENGTFRRRPPYPRDAPRFPAVRPRGGHFDHLVPGTRAFNAAATFAVVRIVLEIWEHHLGRPIRWYFRETVGPSLEIIPLVSSDNAWSDEGYLEFGYPYYPDPTDRNVPFCLNFEVVAHETGHLILKSVIGTMPDDQKSLMHRAHEEAASDLIALLSALHFDSVITFALERTRGKLFSINTLSNFGDWGSTSFQRLRALYNDSTLSWARSVRTMDKYRLARPFLGAAFDAFVEIYEAKLVERGAITRALARASRHAARHAPRRAMPRLQRRFDAEYRRDPAAFRTALATARDEFARLLARTWLRTGRDGVTFAGVVANMLAAERELFRGRYAAIVRRAFAGRGIVPGS